jgi:hypothetical protein
LNGNKGPIIWENPDEVPSRVSFLALNVLKNAREIMKESNQKAKQAKQA